MNKKENIICFSTIDWDFLWQGHQEIMSSFAAEGHRVLFIENTGVRTPQVKDIKRLGQRLKNWYSGVWGIRKSAKNLYVFSPLLLPFPYSKLAIFINSLLLKKVLHQWAKSMKFYDPIIWSFLPTAITNKVIASIDKKASVYYCIDNLSESSPAAQRIKSHEVTMIKKADLVFATSHALLEKCAKHNPNTHFFPFGVSLKNFTNRTFTQRPPELKNLKGPIVGYIGGIHKWIDFDLIYSCAKNNPNINFVLLGPIQTEVSKLKTLKNVRFIAKKQNHELAHYGSFFDVCLIPYGLHEYTNCVYPTKLNEYLAMGKKVISTPIKEVLLFNKEHGDIVDIAHSAKDFERHILSNLKTKTLSPDTFIETARKNSWKTRIGEMSLLISDVILKKKNESEKQEMRLFQISSRSIFKNMALSMLAFLLFYFLAFHSALPSFIARPLLVQSTLKPADVILALGGGVGETGQAGQGYQERVTSAVELYHQGLTKNIIFSSGYKYLMDEAMVMKELAVSMGVPKNNIFIENRSKNTHENIKYSFKLLEKLNFKSVLILSSPYHLRRVDLILKKQARNKHPYQLHPVKNSLFFSSFGTNSNLKQLKAITHEYLAIIYYKWKGFI